MARESRVGTVSLRCAVWGVSFVTWVVRDERQQAADAAFTSLAVNQLHYKEDAFRGN